MASTFADLYADYSDEIRRYTEKLDVTERQFMRNYTKAMQQFQRETEYMERYVELTPSSDSLFYLPDDCLRVVELRSPDEEKLVQQDYMQYARNVEKWPGGYLETPYDYTIGTNLRVENSEIFNYLRGCCATSPGNVRLFTIWARRIYVYPYKDFDTLKLRYIPDIEAFSRNSPQWNTVDGQGAPNGWFPDTRFDTMFRTSGVAPSMAPYEDAFLTYAVMRYIRKMGSVNFREYKSEWNAELKRAKENKPLYWSEGVADYKMAPWS